MATKKLRTAHPRRKASRDRDRREFRSTAAAQGVNVTLRQLRYFDALVQSLHFGRAAKKCSISQPALSMQIQQLEREIGTALIERKRQGIQLTDKGEKIARQVVRILSDVGDLADYAQNKHQLLGGGLRLGVIPTIAPYVLPPLLSLLRDNYPDLELDLRESQTQHLLNELVGGRLDVVLLALPVKHVDIESERLFADHFLLALPRSRRMPAKMVATPDLMMRDQLLLLEEGHCLRDQVLGVSGLRKKQNVSASGAANLSTIVQMVANGNGITLLPEISIDLESRNVPLRLMRFAKPEPHRILGLAWRRSSPRKHDFRALGKLIKAIHKRNHQ